MLGGKKSLKKKNLHELSMWKIIHKVFLVESVSQC